MVEAVANGVEDKLVDGLSFKLSPGASYVTNRRSVTFHPQGSNMYSPVAGTRLIKIALTGDDWLDPSTFRIGFELVSDGTAGEALRTLGDPHSFFRRMRIIAGGQVIEDIDDYNRVAHMFSVLTAKHARENNTAEGFGVVWDHTKYYNQELEGANITATFPGAVAGVQLRSVRELNNTTYPGIKEGQKMHVLFKPLSGLFGQSKFLPLRYLKPVIELELVSSLDVPIWSTFGTAANYTDVLDSNTSAKWYIQNVEAKTDVITLDNALQNSYDEHMNAGKSLPINYNTFVSQMQTIINEKKPSVAVTRALTRLKSVFVTLDKDLSGLQKIEDPGRKNWNTFWSPMFPENGSGFYKHDEDGEFRLSLQIGSKIYPEYPVRSHSEAYYQLKKTLGIQTSDVHSFDITPLEYRYNKLIMGIDTEKVLDAGWTGINTRAGDLLRVTFEYNSADSEGTANARLADRMHIILHSDQIVEVSDKGVQVFD